MDIGQFTGVPKGGFYSIGEIDAHHGTGLEAGSKKNMAAFAAPCIEYDTILKVGRRDRSNPVEKLSRIGIGELGIVRPFVAEGIGGGFLFAIQLRCEKSWNAAKDRESCAAACTAQRTFDNLGAFSHAGMGFQRIAARWTD